MNTNQKIVEINKKLDKVKKVSTSLLPYSVSIDRISPEIISSIEEISQKVNLFKEKIDSITNIINNPQPSFYTNDKKNNEIVSEDMEKLKNYYKYLLTLLEPYIEFNPELTKTTPKSIYNYFMIKPISNLYEKYYFSYLLSNIIALKQSFKLLIESINLTEVTGEKITEIIDSLNNGKKLIIYLEKKIVNEVTQIKCISFDIETITKSKFKKLKNGWYNLLLGFEILSSSSRPITDVLCVKTGKNILFDENKDFNWKKIIFKFKYDGLIVNCNFAFQINYYACKPIGSKINYPTQFILSNSDNKIKFLNTYNEFGVFV
jgi:hypothetical protein